MPRFTTLVVLATLPLLAGCGLVDRPCAKTLAVVHVIDGPGAADRVLIHADGVVGHDGAVLEFTLPADWPARAAPSTPDAMPSLTPLVTPTLHARADIELRRGQSFDPELLPESEARDDVLLIQANLQGFQDRIAEALGSERLRLPYGTKAAFRAALAEERPVYAWFTTADGEGVTLKLLGLAHDPPRPVLLAEIPFETYAHDDPYWIERGCAPPSEWETEFSNTLTVLAFVGFWVLVFA